MKGFDVVIVGGGTAGITVAARLKRELRVLNIAIIEPSGSHYFQPSFSLVASGLSDIKSSHRPMSGVIPEGCEWIRDAVTHIDADQRQVALSGGEKINYRALIVAPGLTLDVEAITGFTEALHDRRHPVCSVYDPTQLEKCSALTGQFLGGTMIFAIPSTPLKCPSAPLKMLYLTDDLLRKSGVREVTRLIFITPYSYIFGIAGFSQKINHLTRNRGIEVLYEHEVSRIDLRNQELLLEPRSEAAAQRKIRSVKYDFANITPHMKPPQFIIDSNLHHAEGHFKNWLEVHPLTLQHQRYINIFGLGDVAGLPTLKSGSAARAQASVVARNIVSLFRKGAQVPLPAQYDGYSCCPIFTEVGQAMHPEIGYEGKLLPSFCGHPFSTRRTFWHFNKSLMPLLYWNLMLKGRL